MKILVVDFAASIGGALSVLKDYYEEVKNDKKNEYIFLLSDSYIKETKNIKIEIIPQYKSWINRLLFDHIIGKKYVNKYKPDIVLSLQNTSIRHVNTKQVLYIHQSIPFQKIKKFSLLKKEERNLAIIQYFIGHEIKKSIKKVNKVIVQTNWMKDEVLKDCKIDSDIIEVVSPKVIIPSNINKNKLNTNHFFYPTSNVLYKNNALIYKAVELLNKENITNFNVELTIDGTNTNNIKFISKIPREEVFKKYTESVLIFPSYIETFGLPLLEARMSNSIILAADTEFSREILRDYPNAYFFNPFDENELYILMKKCINNEIKIKRTNDYDKLDNINTINNTITKLYNLTLFLGCFNNPSEEKQIIDNSKLGIQTAASNFQYNLLDGFIENNFDNLKIINVKPVGIWPTEYKKIYLNNEKWVYNNYYDIKEIGCLNIPVIKQIIRTIKIKKEIKKIKPKNIILYSTYLPFLMSTKKSNSLISLIVTDIPEYYDYAKVNNIKKIIRKIYNVLIYKCLINVDKFILLTKYMNDFVNKNNKPYIVIEGITKKINSTENIKRDNRKKIILYSGTLNEKFGLKNLIDAFMLIDDNDLELNICGAGDLNNYIIKCSSIDKRIHYLGVLEHSKVLKLQKSSTILINPRQNIGEYTKYSFPSKTMEYMQSGTPVLMYKLDGIPDEYNHYLYYINGDSVEDLKQSIIKVLNKEDDELSKFGLNAKTWVEQNKNCKEQCKKIIEFVSEGEYEKNNN